MIVNELVSVLRYQVQEGGLARFRRGLQSATEMARAAGSKLKQLGTNFAQGVGGAGGKLKQFSTSVAQRARAAITQQVALRRAIKATGDQAKKTAEQTSGAAETVKNYIMGAVAGLGLRGAADISDEWAGIRARVGLEVDEAQVDDTLKRLYDMAQSNGVGYNDTSSVYLPFIRNRKDIGVTNEDVLQLTDNIGKLMTIGGGSAASQAAALTQFGQAMGAGKLSGEELNSVLEQAPRLAKAIADSFGVPIGKLKELAEEGKLTSKELAQGLLKQSSSINDEFAKMPITFGRSMTYLQNGLGRFIDRWARLTNAAGLFNKVIRVIVDNIDHLAGMGAIAALLYAMSKLRTLTLAALAPLLRMMAVVAGLYLLGEDLLVWSRGGESFIGGLIGDVSEWQGAIDRIKAGFAWLQGAVGDNSATVGDFAKKWGAIGLVVYALGKPLMFVLTMMGAIVRWGFMLGVALLKGLKVLFVVARVLAALVSWPALIAAGIVAAAVLIWRHFDVIKAFLLGIWRQAVGEMYAAFSGIGSYFATLWAQAVAELHAAFAGVQGYFATLWAQTVAEMQSAFSVVEGYFSALWERVKAATLGVFAAVGQGFSDAMIAAVDFVAGYIPQKLGQAFAAAKEFLNNLLPSSMQLGVSSAAAAGSVASAPALLTAGGATANVENNFNITAQSSNPRDIANAAKGAVEGPSRRAGLAAARGMPNVEALP